MSENADASERDRALAMSEGAGPLPKRWRVLVIDDEPAIGRLIRNLLPHHEINVVPTAEHGLARLREDDTFDVVVCDVMMPELSGMDLYDVLAVERPTLAARFVFITGGTFTERAESFLERIPNRRLDKPFAINDLETAMAQTIAEARGRVS